MRVAVVLIYVAVVMVGAALALPVSAQAAFPGRNGLLAFNGGASLLTMRAGGDQLKALSTCRADTQYPCGGTYPAWSPDGRRIAFSRADERWVMNADGSGARALEGVTGSEPAWAPDGKRIVFTSLYYKGELGLAIVRADGSSGRTLTKIQRDASPAWSPDGRQIAFTRFRSDAQGGQDIYTVPPSGKGLHRLVSGCFCRNPDYSPDGRHIAYDAGRTGQVYVATREGKSRRRLTSAIGAEPSWSPDGRYIAFARENDLYLMNRDGSNQYRIRYDRRKAPKSDRKSIWENQAWQRLPR